MAATDLFRLFLAFLWFSHAICFVDAVPITRSISLVMDIPQQHKVLEINTHTGNNYMEESLEVEEMTIIRRVLEADEEINDYPGSGANNRHTPRPQLGRGCVEC
ncbi:hypothetical protein HAX54_016286 [Datura stramonium]|uniref:Uncharacterized protein n=1 Tax=Datura stramonium TaxID=4076 RepID=A0ABS8RZW5_DATST|nr:hypothetical protein [Datura stramonium]